MSTRDIEEAVKRYQTNAVTIAILVHAFIFVTGIITLVVLKQPIWVFALTHGTIQATALANAAFGHRLYRKYLVMKLQNQIKID
ncbi:MAG TPA: hypothetical protein EYH45_01785 [Candidatus Caldiarchaeum subterraneum]|uniref:2TM domain-containing protein n=1 Tax=Caldiarchaeum subterraneum TaxID=311458 RepID=A0A832ZUW2_CALS0|nr:hypothetical protein [Candidatus Caldarchaeum subterraneum]